MSGRARLGLGRRWAVLPWLSAVLVACGSGSDSPQAPATSRTPARLVIEQQPTVQVGSGRPFATPPIVQLQSASGAPIDLAGRTITVELASGDGTLRGTLSRATIGGGRATFDDLVLVGRAGERTLRFTSPGLEAATTRVIELIAGAPATVTVVRGEGQVADAGTTLPIAAQVRVADSTGNPVAGVPVVWRVTRGGGRIDRVVDTTTADGLASAQWTLGTTESPQRLEAQLSAIRAELSAAARGLRAERLSPAQSHSCALLSDGRAACWGENSEGQLGDGTRLRRDRPVLVSGNLRFTSLSTSLEGSCGIGTNAVLYCWGIPAFTRGAPFGDPTRPAAIDLPAPAVTLGIATGSQHHCVGTLDGATWCWGFNTNGQLGNGTRETQPGITRVLTTERFTTIAVAIFRSCALTASGVAYCWGENRRGGIGDGTTTDRSEPTAVRTTQRFVRITTGVETSCGITADERLFCWGQFVGDGTDRVQGEPVAIRPDLRFTSVSSSFTGTCATSTDGQLFCWGEPISGAARTLTPQAVAPTQRLRDVAMGGTRSCAIEAILGVVCWGLPAGAGPRALELVLPVAP